MTIILSLLYLRKMFARLAFYITLLSIKAFLSFIFTLHESYHVRSFFFVSQLELIVVLNFIYVALISVLFVCLFLRSFVLYLYFLRNWRLVVDLVREKLENWFTLRRLIKQSRK